jgi:hypothetical protein
MLHDAVPFWLTQPHSAGLLEVFLTGGIPPCIDEACPADTVYQATFRRVLVQNQKYYTRFPQDVQVCLHPALHVRALPCC